MTELKIFIAPEKETLIKMIVKELGGEVVEETKANGSINKNNKKRIPHKLKETTTDLPSPTFLFGKWKDWDIDAKKLRAEAWDRSSKFL